MLPAELRGRKRRSVFGDEAGERLGKIGPPPWHRDTDGAVIFDYDGYRGGICIAEKAHEHFERPAEITVALLQGLSLRGRLRLGGFSWWSTAC